MSDARKKRQSGGLRGENHSQRSFQGQNRSKMNSNNKYQRQASYDSVRKIVQEEGRSARNLVKFDVPLQTNGGVAQASASNRPKSLKSPSGKTPRSRSQSSSSNRPTSNRDATPPSKKSPETAQGKSPESRPGSGQATPKKVDMRARYWAFLFENLRRAVDEIYHTCEADESVVECKEVIMMLEQCTKDFRSLIQRLELLKAFEDAHKEGQRPQSLAWEVRKSSPGKGLSSSGGKDHFIPSPSVSRSLNFSSVANNTRPTELPVTNVHKPANKTAAAMNVNSGNSWADKVRGTSKAPASVPSNNASGPVSDKPDVKPAAEKVIQTAGGVKPITDNSDEDTEGWETVHRNSRSRTRPASLSKSKSQESSAPNSPRITEIQARAPYKDAHLSPLFKERASSLMETSTRVDGHESEKENQPVTSVSADNILMLTDTNSHSVQKDGFITRSLSDQGQKPDMKDDSKARAEMLRQKKKKGWVDENYSSDDEAEDGDAEEEKLTTQLQNALQTCLAETDQLEQETEDAIESAIQEEEAWLKEITREKSTEIEVETEADTEAENEADTEADSDLGNTASTCDLSLPKPLDWDTMLEQYDAERQSGSLWGDCVDDPESRTPGRVVHVHEKLSSPSRKRSPTESRRRHEQKQAKARVLREKLQQDQSERLRMLTKKVEEVHAWKEELMEQRKHTMQHKLERAEEKRKLQLQLKIRKAHEEETKANEIAFINTLEAQNKKHDIMSKHQECEARLQDIQEERLRKHEEKLAKEAAVEERRRAIETERQARLQEMQDRRKQRQTDFELRQQEREKERLEAARLKEKEREERMAALNAQQQAHIQQLQRKIQKRQDDTDRRHKEKLEQIQEKAFRMSILQHSTEDGEVRQPPKLVPYARKKICSVCNVMIPSEVYLLSHLRGKRHLQAIKERSEGKDLSREEIEAFNLQHISDIPLDRPDPQIAVDKERQKALKKRCKKLRQRMTQRGSEYESALSSKPQAAESEHRNKLQKIIKDLTKSVSSQDSGPWPQNKITALDRWLGELSRIMEKKQQAVSEQEAVRMLGGLSVLSRLLLVIDKHTVDLPHIIPPKSLVLACQVYRQVCSNHTENCRYLLYSNKIASLVDMLAHQLNMLMDEKTGFSSPAGSSASQSVTTLPSLTFDTVAGALLHLLSSVLSCLAKEATTTEAEKNGEKASENYSSRINDIVSYVVSVGVLDRLAQYFSQVRGPVNNEQQVTDFLQAGMAFLNSLIRLLSSRNPSSLTCKRKKSDDQTQLLSTLRATDLVGIVSLLYGMLLHTGAPGRSSGAPPPPKLPAYTIQTVYVAFLMLNHLSALDLHLLQTTLGDEGTWLEFRHIASYLLWYCSHHSDQASLLHEVILCVGHFTVLNKDNQVIIQSGQAPTVLQQLCSLPFQYFSAPRLTNVLFPTLVAVCYESSDNRQILQQELSCSLLANFIEEKKLETQQDNLSTSKQPAKQSEVEGEERMQLSRRFPEEEWLKAQQYFSS